MICGRMPLCIMGIAPTIRVTAVLTNSLRCSPRSVLVVTLRDEISWSDTRRSFTTQYAVGSAVTTTPSALGAVDGGSQRRSGRAAVSGGQSVRRHKAVSSMRYSVLTARERRFRELADPATVTVDLEAMRRFLTKEAPQVEAVDVDGLLTIRNIQKTQRHKISTFTTAG